MKINSEYRFVNCIIKLPLNMYKQDTIGNNFFFLTKNIFYFSISDPWFLLDTNTNVTGFLSINNIIIVSPCLALTIDNNGL